MLERLIGCLTDSHDVVVPTQNGVRQLLCALYSTSASHLAEELLARGERSVQRFLDRMKVNALPDNAFDDLDPEHMAFQGCNTPAEYQRLVDWDRRQDDSIPGGPRQE